MSTDMRRTGRPAFILLLVGIIGFLVCGHILSPPVLYVSPTGNDTNPGTEKLPLRSITRAYIRIGFNGTVRLLPGTYREEVQLSPQKGIRGTISIVGPGDPLHPAVISGSEPASHIPWTRCTPALCPDIPSGSRTNVFIGMWKNLPAPTGMTELTSDGTTHALTLARSPNAYVKNPDKYHEYWWSADTTNTSPDFLTDTHSDPGLEAGNLTTVKGLTGATAVIMDGGSRCGILPYVRTIIKHDSTIGRITFDAPVGTVNYGIQENGIGGNTKYYVENAPSLLDAPGEWYVNPKSGNLFLWPLEPGIPSILPIEIFVRTSGVRVDTSNVRLEHIQVQNINDANTAITESSGAVVIGSVDNMRIRDISFADVRISNSGNGIVIQPPDSTSVGNITMHALVWEHISKSAVTVVAKNTQPTNVRRIRLADSVIRDVSKPYTYPAINFERASQVTVSGNHITDAAGIGINITAYEKSPGAVESIQVVRNWIDHVCRNASACAAIKFYGGRFIHTVASQNTLSDNLGWSFCDEKVNHEPGFASGIFLSNASGIRIMENKTMKNGKFGYLVYPRIFPATDNTFRGNIDVGSQIGLRLETANGEVDNNPAVYASRHDDTVIQNNVFLHDDTAVSLDPAHPTRVYIDDNRYIDTPVIANVGDTDFHSLQDLYRTYPYWDKHSTVLSQK